MTAREFPPHQASHDGKAVGNHCPPPTVFTGEQVQVMDSEKAKIHRRDRLDDRGDWVGWENVTDCIWSDFERLSFHLYTVNLGLLCQGNFWLSSFLPCVCWKLFVPASKECWFVCWLLVLGWHRTWHGMEHGVCCWYNHFLRHNWMDGSV